MPKVDEVKEFIGLLKIIFTFLLTIIFALTSWIFTSYNKADFLLVLSAIIALIIVSILSILLLIFMIKKITELGRMKKDD